MCWLFFGCAEFCLVLSTAYHLVKFQSQEAERLLRILDLVGILVAIMGTFIPDIYYIFICEENLRNIHCDIVSLPYFCVFPKLVCSH